MLPADYEANFLAHMTGGGLTEVQNPITRTAVKLVPPVKIETMADYDRFIRRTNQYFQLGWEIGRLDPQVLNPGGWGMFGETPENPEPCDWDGTREF